MSCFSEKKKLANVKKLKQRGIKFQDTLLPNKSLLIIFSLFTVK